MARFLVLSMSGAYCKSFGQGVRTGLEKTMSDSRQKSRGSDSGGRRFGLERRTFSYTAHIPERRRGKDRRRVEDPAGKIKKRIMAKFTAWTLDPNATEAMCAVLDDPEPDCYCLNLTGPNIPKAVQYCLKDFRQCPIYKCYMGMPET